MSLSDDERRELEAFRARKLSDEKFQYALLRGLMLTFIYLLLLPESKTNPSIALLLFGLGIISTYFGPFKKEEW